MRNLILFLCVLLVFILIFLSIHELYPLEGDDGRYLVVAQSLSLGKGFTLINAPLEPPDTRVMPFYTVLLGGLIKIFGVNFFLFRVVSAFLVSLAALFLFLTYKKLDFDIKIGIFSLVLFFTNVYTVYSGWQILTEPIFIFLSALSIYLMHLYLEKKKPGFFWVVFVSSACFLCRYVGIFLIIPFAIILAWKRDFKKAVIISGVPFILFCLWNMRTFLVSSGPFFYSGTYFEELLHKGDYISNKAGWINIFELLRRSVYYFVVYLLDVVPDYIIYPLKFLAPYSLLWPIKLVSGFALSTVTLIGFIYCLLRKNILICLYFLFYLAIIFIPAYGVRYLVVVGFLVYLFLALGLVKIIKNKKVVSFVLGIFLFLNLWGDLKENLFYKNAPELESYKRALLWAKDNLPDDALVIAKKSFSAWWLAKRKTLDYPENSELGVYLGKGSYLVMDSRDILSRRERDVFLRSFVYGHKNYFKEIYVAPDGLTKIFKYEPEA
ncbi:MAG: glycosyltransferase family 39 protein [Candidatus Omnitrophica bacterium]|nr:glycosyltransferase family 39 protein [Candidatus Omnitrophota bacterium]